MTKADLGLPSASKASTYQQNREIMPEIAFMSKAELRKTIEAMAFEHKKLRQEVIRLNNKLLQRQEEMINSYRDSSLLKVAI